MPSWTLDGGATTARRASTGGIPLTERNMLGCPLRRANIWGGSCNIAIKSRRSRSLAPTRRRAEGVGELSREAEIAAKRPYGLRLRKLMLKPDLQNTEHGLDPEVLRNAGSKVVAVCCAATSSVIVPLAALQFFLRARRPRSRCGSKTPIYCCILIDSIYFSWKRKRHENCMVEDGND